MARWLTLMPSVCSIEVVSIALLGDVSLCASFRSSLTVSSLILAILFFCEWLGIDSSRWCVCPVDDQQVHKSTGCVGQVVECCEC
jgi:hypothetical protein